MFARTRPPNGVPNMTPNNGPNFGRSFLVHAGVTRYPKTNASLGLKEQPTSADSPSSTSVPREARR